MPTDDTLPEETVDAAVRLTRLARRAVDENEAEAYRVDRAEQLADHDFQARVREEEGRVTLVCHPAEWLDDDGVLRMDAVTDLDRAVEVTLEGAGDPDEWDAVAEHNRDLARRVREAHGDVHGDTAAAFAEFMSNHYARRAETASQREVETFLEEYFPRNAWPSDEQRRSVDESLALLFDAAGRDLPTR